MPISGGQSLPFPGRVIKIGEADRATVLVIQHRLNEVGCGPVEENGGFDSRTENAVKLFQARFSDAEGSSLQVDGKVGPITWAALFGTESVAIVHEVADPLLARVLEVAASQIGVMEQPPGSNRGPQVDKYLRAVGLNPAAGSFAWCVAFVYWCFDQAAQTLQEPNPMIKTAGVLDHWDAAGQRGIRRISSATAEDTPTLIRPGQIFVISTGGGHGHSGLVELTRGGKLTTIEGNTNTGGSREGVGVFRRESRKIADINTGFIDYSNV
jgi:CHAP domain-containing protein/putative peptidoglycan binding protein